MRGKFTRDPTGLYVSRKYIVTRYNNVQLSASNEPTKIFLYRLHATVPGRGFGGSALARLKIISERTGRRIELFSVADFPKDQRRLDLFYQKHGFVAQHDSLNHKVFVYKPSTKIYESNSH